MAQAIKAAELRAGGGGVSAAQDGGGRQQQRLPAGEGGGGSRGWWPGAPCLPAAGEGLAAAGRWGRRWS